MAKVRLRVQQDKIHAFLNTIVPKKAKVEIYVENTPHKDWKVLKNGKAGFFKGKLTSAQIGAIHEYGLGNVPKRSFLRMPIQMGLPTIIKDINSSKFQTVKEMIGSLASHLYNAVIGAFDSGGYGKWKLLSDRYKKATGRVDPPLLDSGQLRDAIRCKCSIDNNDFKNVTLGKTVKFEKI